MMLDHKLNYWQFSEAVLKKKIELYNNQINATNKDLAEKEVIPIKPIPTLKKGTDISYHWNNPFQARN
jgi:hypothetical protein